MIDSRAAADDLREKVHELFAQVMGNLDPQLDRLIKSGCGIVEEHEKAEYGYAVPKAFILAFLQDQCGQHQNLKRIQALGRNYRCFL